MKHNIIKPLVDIAEVYPETNFVEGHNDQIWTYAEFMSKVSSRQKQLKEKIVIGQYAFVSSRRDNLFWIDLVAIWGLGAVAIPFDPEAQTSYLETLVKTVKTDTALGHDIGTIKSQPELVHTGKMKSNDVIVRNVKKTDCAAILFTSGSTGEPKGVVLSHNAISGNAMSTLKVLKLKTGQERLFLNTPFHFTSAICHFLAMAYTGNTLISIEEKFIFADLLNALEKFQANAFGGAPIQLKWIAEAAEAKNSYKLIRWLMCSGDRLNSVIIDTLQRTLPETKIHIFYGLTELGGRFCALDWALVDHYRLSVGKPIEGLSLEIRDQETLEILPANQIGEVYASGEFMLDEYYKNSEATQKSISKDGFKTGDVGYIDEDGYVFLEGRSDDVFKVAGQKVSTIIIVDNLMQTGFFKDVVVVPFEDPHRGSVPFACCVMQDNQEFKKGDVMRYLRQNLEHTHLPQEFLLFESLPRTGSGKIKKNELISLISEQIKNPP